MTEKRYTAKCLDINAWYVERDDGETIVYDLFKCDAEAVADELNSQDAKIKELEHRIHELEHENNILKTCNEKADKYIRRLKDIVNCGNCKHHYRNHWEDMECNKGNNADMGIDFFCDEWESFSVDIKKRLQAEYDKSDIPVWRRAYLKKLANELGIRLEHYV